MESKVSDKSAASAAMMLGSQGLPDTTYDQTNEGSQ